MTELFVKCKPIGKGRPRFTKTGHTYTPKTTVETESLIAGMYKLLGEYYGDSLIQIEIVAKFNPPKSISNKKAAGLIKQLYYDKTPDVDNIAKLVLDALNGVAYVDDKQVVSLHCKKVYTDGEEGLEIKLKKV